VDPRGVAGAQKKARRGHWELAFVDETGHTFRAAVGTTWAPRGHAPVMRRRSQRREVSSIVLLTWHGRLYARHFAGTVRAREVMLALAYFRRRVRRRLLIVWDHARSHSAWYVRQFLARYARDFVVAWLPGYAPDLNPEERCNGYVKRALLNAVPDSVEELRELVRWRFVALGRHPEVLQSFFRHAGLDVT
jgi:hypothetical protein